jgi:hypothetical protein
MRKGLTALQLKFLVPFLVDKTGMCIALTKKDAIELVRELT